MVFSIDHHLSHIGIPLFDVEVPSASGASGNRRLREVSKADTVLPGRDRRVTNPTTIAWYSEGL
jgi:hypothetical protein